MSSPILPTTDLGATQATQLPSNRYSELVGRVIDNTALAAFMACPRKYHYGYNLHRRKGGLPSPSLCYGSGWHAALEQNYRSPEMSRRDLEETVHLFLAEKWQGSTHPDDYRTFDRCFMEYRNYLDKYGLPWQEDAKTIGWPDKPLVEIAVELPIPGARHPYAGKLDRPIEANGQNLIEDHKTASRMENDYFRQWELDNQMIGYAVLAELVTQKEVAGVRINLHVVRKNDSVFERRTIRFSKERLRDWCVNYDRWLEKIEHAQERAIGLVTWEDPPHVDKQIAAGAAAYPQNFAACAGKYGMCTYASVCSSPPRLRQAVLEQEFEVNPWNPLEVKDEGGGDA